MSFRSVNYRYHVKTTTNDYVSALTPNADIVADIKAYKNSASGFVDIVGTLYNARNIISIEREVLYYYDIFKYLNIFVTKQMKYLLIALLVVMLMRARTRIVYLL
jgi:hypothetical protein